MQDPFGRHVHYLRLSVTDRCDLRCQYCMAENMTFLPKTEVLSLEELDRLASAFIHKGIRKLRLTGGEPLVRKNILSLISSLSRHLDDGSLQELTLTTNVTLLEQYAAALHQYGIRRINVSLDTLDSTKYRRITRWGDINPVIKGIQEARRQGLQVKINMVALRGINEDEFNDMLYFCGQEGLDLTLIETMPLGDIDEDRTDRYLPLSLVKAELHKNWTLSPTAYGTSGPARYMEIAEIGQKLGFITPLSHNFCDSCNRIRVTCTGHLYLCLGQNDGKDLRTILRESNDDTMLYQAIDNAIGRKPQGHDFFIDKNNSSPALKRHMNVTGG